jgi:hypothetical protein
MIIGPPPKFNGTRDILLPVPEGELLDQRGLADACLTIDQDQSPATGPSLREPATEGVERRFPLKELHTPMIAVPPPLT